MWTRFMDMHSGGSLKEEPYSKILIEAPRREAKVVFYNRFGHDPDRVTCTCCGNDYSISENDSLEQLTAFDRCCHFDRETDSYVEQPATKYKLRSYATLTEYLKRPDVLVIRKEDIKDSERQGSIPQQGYVWVD